MSVTTIQINGHEVKVSVEGAMTAETLASIRQHCLDIEAGKK